MPLRLDHKSDNFEAQFEEFVAAKRDVKEDVDSIVVEIIEAVRRDGDKAVAAYTEKFDRLSLAPSEFAVDPAEMDAAVDECDDATIEALKTAATRIRAFHETQRPDAMEYEDEAGVRLGARWTALEAVGLYVPGGTASLSELGFDERDAGASRGRRTDRHGGSDAGRPYQFAGSGGCKTRRRP